MNGKQTTHKRILFITGTRADFGKLKPLITAVERAPNFKAQIFATGMHTLAVYGGTIREIYKSGFKDVYAFINQVGSAPSSMDLALATTIQGLSHYVREHRPDLIVVHGDRTEALAGAIVGALNNILVAHIEGGELSGTVDELLRHAISKLSHLHFVATQEAQARLIQMGELPLSIYVIGSPDIDVMLSNDLPPLSRVKQRYGIRFSDYGILLLHPVTTELADLARQVQNILAAVQESGLNWVVIYPNNDHGAQIILDAYGTLSDNPHMRIIPSMRFEYFLALLRGARVILGNSSAGIREAPVYGIPTVDVGTRQQNRFHYETILNVAPDKQAILEALRHLPASAPSLHFGRGSSAREFLQAIQDPKLWATPAQKQFRDLELAARPETA